MELEVITGVAELTAAIGTVDASIIALGADLDVALTALGGDLDLALTAVSADVDAAIALSTTTQVAAITTQTASLINGNNNNTNSIINAINNLPKDDVQVVVQLQPTLPSVLSTRIVYDIAPLSINRSDITAQFDYYSETNFQGLIEHTAIVSGTFDQVSYYLALKLTRIQSNGLPATYTFIVRELTVDGLLVDGPIVLTPDKLITVEAVDTGQTAIKFILRANTTTFNPPITKGSA